MRATEIVALLKAKLDAAVREYVESYMAGHDHMSTTRLAESDEPEGPSGVDLAVDHARSSYRLNLLKELVEEIAGEPVDLAEIEQQLRWEYRQAHPLKVYRHLDGERCREWRCRRKHTTEHTTEVL